MSIMTVEEAQAKLPELIARLFPGEEVVLTRDGRSVAKLVGQPNKDARPWLAPTLCTSRCESRFHCYR
jgi:antitoxin (DNA-binding transcriptional repressor) of toxin-antitoxin stability system